ncbi:MAG: phosphotransferase [Methylobacter tundripaludum]|nr:phosphotransferase [Methylobacter tundripaludum]
MKQSILASRPGDLTVAWAQQVVDRHDAGTAVSNVDVVAVDVGTTTRVCVAVKHNGPDSLPSRWFVKLPSLAWRAKTITALPQLLHTEVRFYNELAQSVPLNKPICLAAQSRFGWGATLVLADVAEFDGIASAASDTLTFEQAVLVVEQLAHCHARFWNSVNNDPNYRWLAGPVRVLEDFLGTVLAVPLMKRGLRQAGTLIPPVLHASAVQYARHRRSAMRFLSDAPQTLVHHDCHPGNLFWNKDRSKVGFLDWQLVRVGEGVSDVAYFLSTALSPEMRRLHEAELLAKYAQALADNGVAGVDNDLLMQRYRVHLVYAFEAMIVTLAVGGMMNLDCNLELIRRTAAAVEDLDAFSAVRIKALGGRSF